MLRRGNQSARRKSRSQVAIDSPHTTFVVEAEGVINVHYTSLTSQGVQQREINQMLTYPDIYPVQHGLISMNGGEQVFPLGVAVQPNINVK